MRSKKRKNNAFETSKVIQMNRYKKWEKLITSLETPEKINNKSV